MSGLSAISSPSRNPVVTIGSWVTGIGLMLLAVQCFVYPGAAEGYGVFPVDEHGFAYLLATGMRDLCLGIVTIYLLLNFRSALGIYFFAMLVVPISDTLIVWRYGDSLLSTWPHVAGIAVLAALSFLCLREQQGKILDGWRGSNNGSNPKSSPGHRS